MFSHAPYMEQLMIYAWRYWALVNRPIHRFALYLIILSPYSFFVQIQKHRATSRWHTRGRNAKWTTLLQDIFSCWIGTGIIRTSQSNTTLSGYLVCFTVWHSWNIRIVSLWFHFICDGKSASYNFSFTSKLNLCHLYLVVLTKWSKKFGLRVYTYNCLMNMM